jgi:integrase
MPKLSKRTIDALSPRDKTFIQFDTDLPGFGVRVMPTGVMSYIVEYRPHGGGRGVAKRRVTLGKIGTLTPDQARKAAVEILAQVRLGADPAEDKAKRREAVTVGDLLDLFDNQYVETMVKPTTAVSHRIAMVELREAFGAMKAVALSRSQLASLHTRMADRPYAANRALAVWAKAFAWGATRGLVPEGHNPAKGIQKFKEQGRERYLTSEELSRLGAALVDGETVGLPWDADENQPKAKHLAKPENRRVKLDPFAVAAIRLLILTGARLREILHAQWSQVDLERGILFLPDSKTGRKPVYLSAAAQAVLASLPRIEGNSYIIAGAKEGKPRADLKKPWAAVCRAAGLQALRIHDLRHSFASFGAGASLGLPIIGKLLGHTQAATTARYAHLDADPLRRAVDTIGATISAAMNGEKCGAQIIPLKKPSSGAV